VSPDDEHGTPEPPSSTTEDRDRLLAEVVAHAEVRDGVYRVPSGDPFSKGRWKIPLALALFALAAVLAVVPPAWMVGPPPPPIEAEDHEYGLRATLYLQAQTIERYRQQEGRLPTSAELMGAGTVGGRFIRSDSRTYQLLAFLPDGSALTYDSARPTDEFDVLTLFWVEVDTP
jgi:hypothetical protein